MLSAKDVRLDSFLLAFGTLKRMQREIAAGEKELQALSRLEQQTDQKMKKTVRGFRFDARGYPLRADDHEKRRQMAGGSRSVRFQSIELDEQCFVSLLPGTDQSLSRGRRVSRFDWSSTRFAMGSTTVYGSLF